MTTEEQNPNWRKPANRTFEDADGLAPSAQLPRTPNRSKESNHEHEYRYRIPQPSPRRPHRVHHQPAPHLRGFRPQGTGREHPQPGRSLSLACAASHRAELRDRRRSQALSRRADGRSRNRSRPHRQPHRRRSIGGAANRKPATPRRSPDGGGAGLPSPAQLGRPEVQHRADRGQSWQSRPRTAPPESA